MFRFAARVAAVLATMLAVLSFAGSADPARAQQLAVTKDLCGPAVPGCVIGGGSALPVVAPNTPVSYEITLINSDPAPIDVDLGETFPAGFVPTGTTCGTTLPSGQAPPFFGPVNVPQGQTICLITGYFNYLPATANNANNKVTVYPAGDHEHPILVSNPVNASVGSPATMPSDVSVVKDAMVVASGNGTTTVQYTITITNNGPNDVYGLQLQDRVALPVTSIPLTVSNLGNEICTIVGSGGSDCFDPIPSTDNSVLTVPSVSPVDFVEWSYPTGATGLLAAGDSIVIEFDVLIEVPVGVACQLVEGGNALINEAHIGFNIPGATTTTFESAPGNNTSTVSVPIASDAVVDPNCGQPALQITKTLVPGSPAVFAWGDTVTYDITLTNASTLALTNIQLFDAMNGALGDFVSGGIGTPAFTAEVVGIACLPTICSSTVPSVGPQSVTGYLNPHWMLGASIPFLGLQSSVTFQVSIKFSDPACDSYPDVTEKPVLNFVRGRYADPTLGGAVITLQSAPAVALFEDVPDCDFKVTKEISDGTSKIVFGQNVLYTVTYENLNAQPMTIGTMIDTLRLTQPNYAWPLTVNYDYICTESGGVTGFPVSQSGVVQVVPTSLPQQGVRIIQNLTPVVFPGNSTVTCEVRIRVEPPVGASQCARLGELQNAAIMDQSAFYDPNLPWNTTPGFYDAVTLPLPQCFDLVVNKAVNPIWTTENGGPLNYSLIVSNLGEAIVAADGISVSDNFLPNLAVSAPVDWCLDPVSTSTPNPFTPDCAFAWSSPPPSNPSTLDIVSLSQDWSANPRFTVSAPYPAAPGQVCNDAVVSLSGLDDEDWYAKDASTWASHRCVPIFDTKDLKVAKLVDVVAPASAPPSTSFNVDVSCSLQPYYSSDQSFVFDYPPTSIPAQAVLGIPNNSTCTIIEQPLPVGPFPDKRCPSGFAAWGAITYPNAVGPDGTPQSVIVGNNSSNTLLVRNTYECVREIETGSLFVGKDVVNNTSADLSGWTFPVTVDCTGQPPVSLDLVAGQYSVIHNLPIAADCHVTEDWQNIELPPAEKACPPGLAPQWQPASYEPANQIIGALPLAITIHNVLDCVRPEKPVDGTLTVEKKVTNNTAADLSGWTYPVAVACSQGPETVLSLTEGQPGILNNVPLESECKFDEDVQQIQLPRDEKACPPGTVPQWRNPPIYTPAPPVSIGGAPIVVTIENTLDCVRTDKPVTGTITIVKRVTNNTNADLSGWQYAATVSCDGGPEVFLNLAEGESFGVGDVPFGVDCKVTEDVQLIELPTDEKACPPGMVPQWSSYQVGPDYLQPGGEKTIVNVLDCVRLEKPLGSLTVWKYVSNQTLFPLTGWQYTVTVDCGGAITTLSLADGASGTVSGIPNGTTCNVAETLPLPLPPGGGNKCFTASMAPEWSPPVSYLPGSSVQIVGQAAMVYVLNTLRCVPIEGDTGSLTITKSVTDLTNGSAPAIPFTITVDCGAAGITVLTLQGGGSATVPDLPLGTNCNVTEGPPPPPDIFPDCPAFAGWSWPPAFSPSSNVTIATAAAGSPQTAVVTNIFECMFPPVATGLTIKKTITSDTIDVTGQQNGDFQVQVSCSNPASLNVVTLTYANGYQASLPDLPSGAQCSVVEVLSQNPSLPAGQQWVASYPAGNQVTIQTGNQIFLFDNERVWNAVLPGQSDLRVTKDFLIHGELDPNHTMTFTVAVNCTDASGQPVSGFDPLIVNLTPNFVGYMDATIPEATYSSWANLAVPVASTCTVSEPTLPPLSANLSGCNWVAGTPTYSNQSFGGSQQAGPSTTLIVPQQTYTLDVANELVCPPFILAPAPDPTLPEFALSVTQPEQCERGKACTFTVVLTNEAGDAYSGPLFLSADLPASVGSNGEPIGDWYCARSDMGSLCYVPLDGFGSTMPLTLDLPLGIPARASASPQACFSVEMPSSTKKKSVVRAAQLGLAAEGFALGTVDGLIGPKSRAAIASLAKRSGAILPEGEMNEVYRLLFGTVPFPKGLAGSGETICIDVDLKPLPERATPRRSEPAVDKQPDVQVQENVKVPKQIMCVAPAVPNRAGTACVCRGDAIAIGNRCVAPNVTINPPKLEFPGGFVMPKS